MKKKKWESEIKTKNSANSDKLEKEKTEEFDKLKSQENLKKREEDLKNKEENFFKKKRRRFKK